MPGRTMIYGSGAGDADGQDNLVKKPGQGPVENNDGGAEYAQAMEYLKNPLTAPLGILMLGVSSVKKGGAGLGGPMTPRRFSPWGDVVPTTTTKELNRKNIFG